MIFRPYVARYFVLALLAGLLEAQSFQPVGPADKMQTAELPRNTPASVAKASAMESYGNLPLSFEANQGQTDSQVRFLSRGSGYALFLTGQEAVFGLRNHAANSAVLRMKLDDANPNAQVAGVEEFPGTTSYFSGKDPAKWRSNVPNYAKVKYQAVYPGIDLVYYGNQRQLEYDFVIAPGADPGRIQFHIAGARRMRRDSNGDLVLAMAGGEVRWRKPLVYQEEDGKRQEVGGRYVVKSGQRVAFEVESYDVNRALIIDPIVAYSTYIGGDFSDSSDGIAVDGAGNAYITGTAGSLNFPTVNALQPKLRHDDIHADVRSDAFVTKINRPGSALVYSTYLGSNGNDSGVAIAVDAAGSVYLTGQAGSNDFPVVNPIQSSCSAPCGNSFILKLNPSGSALVYSTYLQVRTDTSEGTTGIAVDHSGNAYVTGSTSWSNFPTVNALQPTRAGGVDAFITVLNPAGSAFVYSTYLGGSSADRGKGIAVDGDGNAYVTGVTNSINFPTVNALQPAKAGVPGNGPTSADAFVSKINASGSALVYSTYLGGSVADTGNGIAADSLGDAYVGGSTLSLNFPTTPDAVQPIFAGGTTQGGDAFVTKLNPSGSALVYSTYVGGSGWDDGDSIAVSGAGNAYITGFTLSPDFPTVNPTQPTIGACCQRADAFVTELNASGSALLFSTFLGGGAGEGGAGVAVDGAGALYVTGSTDSSDFPTRNALQQWTATFASGFVTKYSFAQVTLAGLPQQPLTKDAQGNFVARVTITNTGNVTIPTVQVSVPATRLGSTAPLSAPAPVTNLAPGGSVIVQLKFPPAAAPPTAAAAALKIGGTYSVPSVPLSGSWALSFRSVNLK